MSLNSNGGVHWCPKRQYERMAKQPSSLNPQTAAEREERPPRTPQNQCHGSRTTWQAPVDRAYYESPSNDSGSSILDLGHSIKQSSIYYESPSKHLPRYFGVMSSPETIEEPSSPSVSSYTSLQPSTEMDVCLEVRPSLELVTRAKPRVGRQPEIHSPHDEWEESKKEAVKNVYRYVRSATSSRLCADGGDTNAEITQHSANFAIEGMVNDGILAQEDVFFDGGCAYNVFASHVAQIVGCRVWGCEYVSTRIFIGANNMINALDDNAEVGALCNKNIAYVPCNLYHLQSLGPTTVAYFFDEAFPLDLIKYVCCIARATVGVKYICSYKASKWSSVHELIAERGFVLYKSYTVRKTGSGELNTLYVYRRNVKPGKKSWQNTYDGIEAAYVSPAWSEDDGKRRRHYQRLLKFVGDASARRALERRHKAVVPQTAEAKHLKDLQARGMYRVPSPCECMRCYQTNSCTTVLLLGMVYWDTDALTVDTLVRYVGDGTLTPAEARDTARCLAIEAAHPGAEVYTVSNANIGNVEPRVDRHVSVNFGSRHLVNSIKKLTGSALRFDQIALDYFWLPRGYAYDRIGKGLATALPALCRSVLEPTGCVYLPFHTDVIEALEEVENSFFSEFATTLISADDDMAIREHLLFTSTLSLPARTMESVFQKSLRQHDVYCKLSESEIRKFQGSKLGENLHVGQGIPQSHLSNARFIRLQRANGKR